MQDGQPGVKRYDVGELVMRQSANRDYAARNIRFELFA